MSPRWPEQQDTAQRQHHREPRWRRGEPSLIECDIGRPRPQRAVDEEKQCVGGEGGADDHVGQLVVVRTEFSGTTLPTPIATASAVSAVLHQASGRSLARHLRAAGCKVCLGVARHQSTISCSRGALASIADPRRRALTPTRSLPRAGLESPRRFRSRTRAMQSCRSRDRPSGPAPGCGRGGHRRAAHRAGHTRVPGQSTRSSSVKRREGSSHPD